MRREGEFGSVDVVADRRVWRPCEPRCSHGISNTHVWFELERERNNLNIVQAMTTASRSYDSEETSTLR